MAHFTIARHAVPVREAYGGLSDPQHAMLYDEHPIRFSQADGCGKSYAFQWRSADGLRVLLSCRRAGSPRTRRRDAPLAAEGIGEDAIARRIVIWTSDERRRLETEDPTVR
jgi:hypothetical protein